MVDKYTTFTYYDWADDSRPELQIYQAPDEAFALLDVGKKEFVITISADDKKNLKDQLEGYAEIFKAAADSLGGEAE